ncbi:hypothetical protein [Psychroserpens sp. Hel_I_66]|uniref:hypothetical protein n=1 Tax=Psychroserpens sp. Hel_I_66 TaxID=1250004 RepID=UPI000A454C7B|nr:hypothetical protein [Psychroserpens sp. Hel_I_66]
MLLFSYEFSSGWFAQQDSISELKKLDRLISEEKFDIAQEHLQKNIEDLIEKNCL